MDVRKRILIVDDELGIVKILGIKLGLSGYDVINTTSGTEAIELLRKQEPDIMLLDMVLPDMSGMDVIDRVRAFSQVPIIMYSGLPNIAELARKLEVNDYIGKPFDPDLLVDKIRLVLSTHHSVRGYDANKEESPSR
ncbi:MAG: response regulator [Dehalococcoidales bacterium]|nr:MAG: response regulator [Dehalococcoidales bacterium]